MLTITTDRAKARRWLTLILVANGVIALVALVGALWAASALDAAWGGAAMAFTACGCVFQMVFHAFFYGRLLGSDPIAVIGSEGIRGPTSRWEQVALPWASIASVTSGWNAVVVKPVPGAGPKLVIPTRATSADTATVRAAVSHVSGGRL